MLLMLSTLIGEQAKASLMTDFNHKQASERSPPSLSLPNFVLAHVFPLAFDVKGIVFATQTLCHIFC